MTAQTRNQEKRRRYTVADVRRAFSPEKANEERLNMWPIYYGPRFLSFYLTPPFLNAGITPSAVTVIGLIIALLLPFLALLDQPLAISGVSAAGVLFALLDCIDGDIARTKGLHSRKGAYLDFISDIIYRYMFCLSLGIMVKSEATGDAWLIENAPIIGLGAAALYTVARCCRFYSERKTVGDQVYAQYKKANYSVFDRIFFFVAGMEYTLPVLVIFFGLFQNLYFVLAGVFIYFLLDFIATQYFIWKRF